MLNKLFDIKVTTGEITDTKVRGSYYQSSRPGSTMKTTKYSYNGSSYDLAGQRVYDTGFPKGLEGEPKIISLNYKPLPYFIFTQLFSKKPKNCSRVALFTIDLSLQRQEDNVTIHKGWTCSRMNDIALLVISLIALFMLKFMHMIAGGRLSEAGSFIFPVLCIAAGLLLLESASHLILASQSARMMRQYFRDNNMLKNKTTVEVARTNLGFSTNPNYPSPRIYLGRP